MKYLKTISRGAVQTIAGLSLILTAGFANAQLTVSEQPQPASIDLTAIGTTDWVS